MENHSLAFHLDWALFSSTFVLIFLAELPDKTAMAVLILASRHHPLAVFTGSALAFLIQSMVAVLCGGLLGLLPPHVIHLGSGLLFLVLAGMMWFRRKKEGDEGDLDPKAGFFKTVRMAFIVIFLAEWGDLTQLASATLVAKTHQPWTIFLSATLALWTTTAVAIAVGHHAKKVLRPRLLESIAAVAFALVGILLLSGFWDK